MAGGLRYETGRDMPPGMLEKAAVKIAQNLQVVGMIEPQSQELTTEKKTVKTPHITMKRKKTIDAENLLMAVRDDPEVTSKAFAQLKRHIKAMPAVSGWIQAAERKPDFELQEWRKEHPDEPLQVLVTIKGAKVATILSYDEDGDFFAVDDFGDVDYCNVTHWQPVPEVPGVVDQ